MKLKLQKIKIRNFFSYGSSWTKIPFLPGVNLVTGRNGAGKSSFLEGISFALFGKTQRDIKKEQIINWSNRKGAEVELYFSKDNVSYKIIRSIKPDNLEIWKDGTLIPKPSHIKNYQKSIEDITGLSYPIFSSLVHTNINSNKPILGMNKPEKRKFLEKAFGLELYTNLNDLSNSKLKAVNDKIREGSISTNHNVETINDIKDRIYDINKELGSLRSSKIQLNETKERLNDIDVDKEQLEQQLNDMKRHISDKSADYEYNRLIVSKVNNKTSLVDLKLKNEKKKLKEMSDKELLHAESVKKKIELDKLIERYGTVDDIQKAIDSVKKKKVLQENELESINNELNKERELLIAGETKVKGISDRLLMLLDKSLCPTCGRKMDDCEYIIEEMKCEIETLEEDILNQRYTIASIKDKIEETNRILKNTKYGINDLEEEVRNIQSIQAEIGKDFKDDYGSIKDNIKSNMARYYSVIRKLYDVSQKLTNKHNRLDNEITALEESELEFKIKLSDIRTMEEDIDRLEQIVSIEEENKTRLTNLLHKDKDVVKRLKDIIDNERKKKIKYNEMIDYLNYIKTTVKDEAVKQYAISTIMPYLNKQVNHYLSEVGHPFYVIIDKWLDAEIKGPGITKGTYGSLSGGEGRSIDLSLQLGMLDVARMQSGVWPDMTTFDELLDSSVDSSSIGKLMDIIDVKQKEDEESKIFIISHRPEIDEIEVDNVYFVEKINGYSRITVK